MPAQHLKPPRHTWVPVASVRAGKPHTNSEVIADAAMQAAYADGKRVKLTGEPYEVWSDDSPETLAFWDGYYGRPLKRRTWGARG